MELGGGGWVDRDLLSLLGDTSGLREEGVLGLYRGLGTNLVRQIPNTAVMMATYEVTPVPSFYLD